MCGDYNRRTARLLDILPRPRASTAPAWCCSILLIVLLCASSKNDQSTTVSMGGWCGEWVMGGWVWCGRGVCGMGECVCGGWASGVNG